MTTKTKTNGKSHLLDTHSQQQKSGLYCTQKRERDEVRPLEFVTLLSGREWNGRNGQEWTGMDI